MSWPPPTVLINHVSYYILSYYSRCTGYLPPTHLVLRVAVAADGAILVINIK